MSQNAAANPASAPNARVRKRILALAGLVLLAPVLLLPVAYIRLNRMLDLRLSGRASLPVPLVYSAPRRIAPGQAVSIAEISQYLESSGYRSSPSGAQRGTIRRGPGYLEIHPGSGSYFRGSNALRVELAAGRIRRIVDLESGQTLEDAQIEPELLTSLPGEERERRRPVSYSDLPGHLVAAVLSAEDKRFFEHPGIDPVRVVGAARFDILHGSRQQGASTLTMQLSRSLFFDLEREWSRKLAETAMALIIEARFTKKQIFELYANEIYLGNRGGFAIHGFGEAARSYFGKDVHDLTLGESCFLAGIIRSPNRYSDRELDPRTAAAARDRILRVLEADGVVSSRDVESARNAGLEFAGSAHSTGIAPHFVDMVQKEVLNRTRASGRDIEGSSVYTTLETDLQAEAVAAVDAGLKEIEVRLEPRLRSGRIQERQGVQAALVALDVSSGGIRALVGGRDYQQSQLNRALASRQPGSVFKPFVYACAFSTGLDHNLQPLTPASIVVDEPTTFQFDGRSYSPANFGEEYSGAVTLRESLARSLNVATVRLAEQVGYARVVDLMRRIVPEMRIEATPSVALGAYEMTPVQVASAYTAFARGGARIDAWFLDRVISRSGTVELSHPVVERDGVDPRVAFLVTNIMQDVINKGTGARVRSLGFKGPAAGKTGTSRDGWFAGFTPDLLCVVWVGFDDSRELGLSGGNSAALIWAEFMKRAVLRPGYSRVREFSMPEGIEVASVDIETAMRSNSCPDSRLEYFIAGTAPTQLCDVHRGLRWTALSPFRWTAALFQAKPAEETLLMARPRWESPGMTETATLPPASAGVPTPALEGGAGKRGILRRFFGLFRKAPENERRAVPQHD